MVFEGGRYGAQGEAVLSINERREPHEWNDVLRITKAEVVGIPVRDLQEILAPASGGQRAGLVEHSHRLAALNQAMESGTCTSCSGPSS